MDKKQIIIEIYEELLKELDDTSKWTVENPDASLPDFVHVTKNIKLDRHRIFKPDRMTHPFGYARRVRKSTDRLLNLVHCERFSFILNYIKGEYPYYHKWNSRWDDIDAWLVTLDYDDFKIVSSYLYFKNEDDNAYFILKWL